MQDILPAFIRKQINEYDLVGGPNCFNSGVCVNQGNGYTRQYTNSQELGEALNSDYVKMNGDAPLQAGDLLLYSDEFGNPVHVATYINEDIVFTKNGINKFNPYIFQRTANMEATYNAGRLVASVHRPKYGRRIVGSGRIRANKIKDCLPVIMFN